MNKVLNQISTRIMKRMETRLLWRKENLSDKVFFEGKNIIVKPYDTTNYQWTTSFFKTFLQAIGLEQSFRYKNSLSECVLLTVRPLYRIDLEK
ncbi:hypothetical protein V1477_013845 [Vespula maculifrons]|uniref:Uncharacterized protein n=1 Tax=Vespula maculifrons TaxID=7453 RepID=A0ABD2BPG2_VESMC